MPHWSSKLFFVLSPLVQYTVSGNSMMPMFQEEQHVLVKKYWFFCRYKKGDVIILKDPRTGRLLLKRIQQLDTDRVFVVGDNEKESTDSRHFGWVKIDNTIGKVISA